MALYLYRYHSKDCAVHTLKLSAPEKKFYMECDCPLWLTGRTDTEDYPRQSLGTRDLKTAEAKLRQLTAKGKDVTVHGLTISDCIQKFLDQHGEDVSDKTKAQHKLVLERLEAYAKTKNKFHVHDLTVDLIEDFKTYGMNEVKKSTSRATAVSKLKVFLKEALRRGWITEPLHMKVKSVKANYEQKLPYTDDEVKLIFDWAGKLNGGTTGYASKPATFRLLLEFMLLTGLRVSDAIRFDPRQCFKSQQMFVYSFVPTKKRRNEKPKKIKTYLTETLKTAIDKCDGFSTTFPFAYRSFADDAQERAVYERMQELGKRCRVDDCRPHRLRDTFAVRLLLKGMALEDVSRLLGHSSVAITEKYYAAWVLDRELRLERLLSETLQDPVKG
jgi:integrase/recombinase XerD